MSPGVTTYPAGKRRIGSRLAGVGLVLGLLLSSALTLPAHAATASKVEVKSEAKAEAKPDTRARCFECHDDKDLKTDDGKPMAVLADEYGRSAHRKLDCAECHDAALAVKHPKFALGAVKPQVCQDCHEDEFKAVAGSIHGRRAKGERAIKDCAGCHGSLHTVFKSGDPRSPLSPVNQIKTCGACHKTILAEWKSSAHGALLAAGKDGPVCSSCHEPHAIKRPDTANVRHEVAGRCGHCHDDVVASFRDSFHGKASALKNAQAAVCADCHTPHANLPKSNPKSSVNPANLAKTCGACHANVNASFLSFDPHANPADRSRNPWVHWIWVGMTALLLGVFGFFGLHGLLWLQRALVGRLRGEFTTGHVRTGPHVRRFGSMQIGVHITIVTSFLLLAATGLPLKFAQAPWAPALVGLLGGQQVAGWLHRFAAVVTFGYFAWHLGMLFTDVVVKKERGFFWGPRSMVPQPRDVRELVAMFRYFLYLGPRPKFDRFTYWEKFDYLAVFWGVAIIGISGLVLWFPTAATTVLPGWALNAAYVIHSDEALLATGFIFLFHFFHTHLRPESFPMDTVVFTGRMPLETFKHERPLEYERLVAAGRLEELMAPAPTAGELRFAYIFGFAAVAIGVVLAVFIFWGLAGSLMH